MENVRVQPDRDDDDVAADVDVHHANSYPYRDVPDSRLVGLPGQDDGQAYLGPNNHDIHVDLQDAGVVWLLGQDDDGDDDDNRGVYHVYIHHVYVNLQNARVVPLQGSDL